MDLKELKNILNRNCLNDEQLNELRNTLLKYPFFQPLRILLITNMKSVLDINSNAIFVPDRKYLYNLLNCDSCSMNSKKVDISSVDENRTVELIDSFLSGCEYNDEISCDLPNDYMAYAINENNSSDVNIEDENDLISHFINKNCNNSASECDNDSNGDYSLEEENIDDVCFTETLAKIYIKQERYDKAIEIIRKLSLKYPKKNVYFADQLKALEKLIINNKPDNKKCTYS